MVSRLRANFLHLIQRRRRQQLNFHNEDCQFTSDFTNDDIEHDTICMKNSFRQNEKKVYEIKKDFVLLFKS